MKGQRVAAFSRPHPRRSLTLEGDLLAAEARLRPANVYQGIVCTAAELLSGIPANSGGRLAGQYGADRGDRHTIVMCHQHNSTPSRSGASPCARYNHSVQ
jgi:hypothetical protein